MSYSYNLYSNTSVGGEPGRTGKQRQTFIPVRVIDVILDDSHEEWNKLGKSEAIGAIKYAPVSKNTEISDTVALPAAYPLRNDFKKLPLKNEIVLIMNAPGYSLDNNKLDTKVYYDTIVNLWNHPNHGGFPPNTEEELDLGEDIVELTDVNPMQPFPGDIILDGRQGQSLRFTGFPSTKNEFVDRTNRGNPLTILSNGQKTASNPYDPIVEDVNEDASSIYLTSNHKVPLNQARDKTISYGFNTIPLKANEYQGSQVVINGGRLYFNAKEEGIFLNSNEYIGLQSNYVNIDGVKEISLDAELIFLGEGVANAPQSFKEPVLLGNQTVALINTFLEIVRGIADSMKKAKDGKGRPIVSLVKRGAVVNTQIKSLKKSTSPFGSSPLKSKKVFTE